MLKQTEEAGNGRERAGRRSKPGEADGRGSRKRTGKSQKTIEAWRETDEQKNLKKKMLLPLLPLPTPVNIESLTATTMLRNRTKKK